MNKNTLLAHANEWLSRLEQHHSTANYRADLLALEIQQTGGVLNFLREAHVLTEAQYTHFCWRLGRLLSNDSLSSGG